MSLDVWLTKPEKVKKPCPHCGNDYAEEVVLYESNITHNLGKMAGELNIYTELWRPEEKGIRTAAQLIKPLTFALKLLRENPDKYSEFEPENKWGTYSDMLEFMRNYLTACMNNPEAIVNVDR